MSKASVSRIGLIGSIIEKVYLSYENNLVYYDQLTGSYNRNYYERVIKYKYLDGSYLVVYVDINNLKMINDSEGHARGSRVIAEVSRLLKSTDPLVTCRLGGDEFLVIYDTLRSSESISNSLNKITQISYGMYLKDYYEDVSNAVRVADQRMYDNKRSM